MKTLRVTVPTHYESHYRWISKVVFEEFLGVDYVFATGEQDWTQIEICGRYLRMPLIFPSPEDVDWLTYESLPKCPLKYLDVESGVVPNETSQEPLPILFGEPKIADFAEGIYLSIDLWGTFFFMLSRYEEVVNRRRDAHDRFAAVDSVAFQAGFLERPIVDEYVEFLWCQIRRMSPNLQRRQRVGRVFVTCDVDMPYDSAVRSTASLARRISGDLIRTRSVRQPLARLRNWLASRRGDYSLDPYDTFDWYLDACERAGRQAAFYFIAEMSVGNAFYDVGEPRMLELIKSIKQRGHEVGMHGSYYSYRSKEALISERQRLHVACVNAGVETPLAGNRQHYLRWAVEETPDHLDDAGFEYDTTGSFADIPGFRYGTARTFTMWSWRRGASLAIKQRPLILMESSVIADRYMGLGYSPAALDKMQLLKKKSLAHGGDFVLLWHNSHLTTPEDREFFSQLIGT